MKAAIKNTQGQKCMVAGGRRSAQLADQETDFLPPYTSCRPTHVGKARTKMPTSLLGGRGRCLDPLSPGDAKSHPRAPGSPAQPHCGLAPPLVRPLLPPTNRGSSPRANRLHRSRLADQPSRLILTRQQLIGAGFGLAATEEVFSVVPAHPATQHPGCHPCGTSLPAHSTVCLLLPFPFPPS